VRHVAAIISKNIFTAPAKKVLDMNTETYRGPISRSAERFQRGALDLGFSNIREAFERIFEFSFNISHLVSTNNTEKRLIMDRLAL
jgi:hypothetical protein